MNNALSIGAEHQLFARHPSADWQHIESAPHDGTVIEIMNNYGVAPSYGLFKWADYSGLNEMHWVSATNSASAISSESFLRWRSYEGNIADYQDPTGGAQNDMAYWRAAIAAKYGLPLDHFEEQAKRNRERNERLEQGVKWWHFWK